MARREIQLRMSSSCDREFKIVIVGEPQVGKTSLAKRFASKKFVPHLPATLGVDYSMRILEKDNDRVKVEIWDTSGVESMRSIFPNYFHTANAIIFTYDITSKKSFDKMNDWFKAVREMRIRHVLYFIVGTKSDLAKYREVPAEEIHTLAKSINLTAFETSSLLGTDVEDTFMSIVDALYAQCVSWQSPVRLQRQEVPNTGQSCCGTSVPPPIEMSERSAGAGLQPGLAFFSPGSPESAASKSSPSATLKPSPKVTCIAEEEEDEVDPQTTSPSLNV